MNIYKNLQVALYLVVKKMDAFPLISGIREEYVLPRLLISTDLEVLDQTTKQEKEIKSILTGKAEVKMCPEMT
jgi:hypothetical protein